MRVRQIDPGSDDFDALLALVLAAFASMDGRIDPPSSARLLTADALRGKARQETGLVVEIDGRPAACLFCRDEPPDALYIGKLAVDPARQGKGLGRALLAAVESRARALGRRALRLETRIELVDNHRIFTAWGFLRTAENRHAGYDRTTSVEMTKRLDPA